MSEASENVPVVLRCKDECVAIPIKILVQESTVFRAMLGFEEKRNDSLMNQEDEKKDLEVESESIAEQAEDTRENSNQGKENEDSSTIQDLERDEPEYEYEEADYDQNKKRKANEDSSTNKNKKQKNGGSAPSFEIDGDRQQVDMIEITGFHPLSVKTLFEYLKGYQEFMEKSSLTVKVEMIALCWRYRILGPVPKIGSRILNTKLTTDNLIDAGNALSNLQNIGEFDTKNLREKFEIQILDFSKRHFCSWKNIAEFILKNKCSMEVIIEIFEKIQKASSTTARYGIPVSKWKSRKSAYRPTILKNMLWYFELIYDSGTSMVQVCTRCHDSTGYNDWTCKATVKYSLYNYENSSEEYSKILTHVFNTEQEWSKTDFMSVTNWDRLITDSEKRKYFQDDKASITVEVTDIELEMHPDFHGYELEVLGWEDECILAWKSKPIEKEAPQIKEVNFWSVNLPVLLNCDGNLISIPYSILIQESTYFKSKYSAYWNSGELETTYGAIDSEAIDDRAKMEIEVIKISGYNSMAVKALFDYLQGYKNLLETCDKFPVLGDMLKLCDFYGIHRPIKDISARMKMLPINLSNLIDALEFAKNLEIFEEYKKVSASIANKCLTYARGNLFEWPLLMKLVVDNSHRNEFVVCLLEDMCEKKEATFRMKLTNIQRLRIDEFSNYFIFNLFKWRVHVSAREVGLIECKFKLEDLDEKANKPSLIIKNTMKIWKQDGTCHQQVVDNSFLSLTMQDLEDQGFITQDKNAYLELKITSI